MYKRQDYAYSFNPNATPTGEKQSQSLIEHPEISETFTAEKEQLKQISLKFENVGRNAATGNVILQVRGKNGQTLASSLMPISQVRTDNRPTIFDININLNRGETYTFAVINDNIHNENGVSLYAVSYTHLDVYKRQGQTLCRAPKIVWHSAGKFRPHRSTSMVCEIDQKS